VPCAGAAPRDQPQKNRAGWPGDCGLEGGDWCAGENEADNVYIVDLFMF
jgi:hypothetical protein